MGAAKPSKTTTRRRVNMSQPSQILLQKQKAKIRALMAEERRQAEARKQYENFLRKYAMGDANNNNNNNNNNNSPGQIIASIRSTMKKNAKRKTRRISRK